MRWNKSNLLKALILLAALGFYALGLYENAHESSSRSLQLKEETTAADRVLILATVTGVNPTMRQITAQLDFRFAGRIAQDEVTPRVDLRLLTNSVGGQQEFNFPRGKRMNRIEATFSLDGDVNKYPFDRYQTFLSFFVTTPRQANVPVEAAVAQKKSKKPRIFRKKEASHPGGLMVGASALLGNVSVPLSIELVASVPQIKFTGAISRQAGSELTEIGLNLKRPDKLMRTAFTVMILMMSLAISVLAMAIRSIAAPKKFDFLPLSLALSLIFGLPALRNIQPGIPPVGAFGDNFSFIWAELFVAAAAIIIMWTWLLRSDTN